MPSNPEADLRARSLTESELAPSILLIDDDHDILDYYQDALATKGYRIQTASDGKEAVALAKWRRFDLILSDISMPGMDGITMLRVIRESNLDVPVILATSDPRAETAIRALEYGAFRYLTMPVPVAELRRVVEYGICLNRMARAKRRTCSGFRSRSVPSIPSRDSASSTSRVTATKCRTSSTHSSACR